MFLNKSILTSIQEIYQKIDRLKWPQMPEN